MAAYSCWGLPQHTLGLAIPIGSQTLTVDYSQHVITACLLPSPLEHRS